jgi:hypothetical protein
MMSIESYKVIRSLGAMSQEEVKSTTAEVEEESSVELDDSELEEVAGGVTQPETLQAEEDEESPYHDSKR